ncbi:hypothetical protein TOPH_00049 [Tolypocladium ophioglossoides CBS 100239]|uniref:Zn(2)-C6 fungal-type domain-containing protein n=1 Tax=Tolypocladium ophioglossoides (strain CBS 100239) TaxID=1163406 RepID=A0A0L0NL37_TOLOC|nr:hypothetical protein TOPH_00049 [Tolypocladium ophioglossoides CBS 100239]
MQPDASRPVHSPSSSATSPMPRPPESLPLRLRLACDACNAAKVRCGKTHPCERCTQNHQECRYSASRRHGKRPRQRKTGPEPEAPCSPPSSAMATPAAAAASTMMSDFSEFIWGDGNEGSLHAAFSLDNVPESLEGLAHHDMAMALDLDGACGTSPAEPWRSPEPMANADQLPPSEAMHPPEKTASAEQRLASMGTAAPSVTSQSSDSLHAKQAHDCETLALRVLDSLHYSPTGGQTVNTCKGPHTAADGTALANSASHMPSVDTVLSANQAALTNLTPLLKCPCARSPHIALLHTAILSKAIFWYRVAVTARHHAGGVELRPMKIKLGMLDLDDDDQATLQRAVLLREIRKAERVIETFDACSAREDEVPTWHGLTICKMRDELKALVQDIKRGQSEWP